jgi:capsular exopolysaccharide synthesis family protein
MELGVYLKPLLKWWWMILLATIVALLASLIVTLRQAPVYQSRTTLVTGRAVYESNPTGGDLSLNQTLASYYADLAIREPVRNTAMEMLGVEWLPEYRAQLLPNSQIIEIVVADTDPKRAEIVANTLAAALIKQTPTQNQQEQARQAFIERQLAELETRIENTQAEVEEKSDALPDLTSAREIAEAEAEITRLEDSLQSYRENYSSLLSSTDRGAANTLSVLEQANLPRRPVGPNKMMSIALAGAVALALSVGAAYLLEYIDDTLKTPDDIRRILDLPTIGFISQIDKGKYHGDYVAKHPRSSIAESFRALRTDLEFAGVDQPIKTILMTSPGVAAGKTSTAINLAVVMAQGGKKVYLLDADLRKPTVHRSLGLPNRQGLSDVFRRDKDVRDLAQFWQEGNIHIVTSGPLPPNPAELLASHKMDQVLKTLEDEADVVIIDGPPFLVTDATILSAKSQGVLLVIRYGNTRKNDAISSVKQLQRSGARILGVILNQIPRKSEEYTGLYRYYAGYYAERDEEDEAPQNGKTKLPRIFSKQPKGQSD